MTKEEIYEFALKSGLAPDLVYKDGDKYSDRFENFKAFAFYVAQHEREWVGLTNEDMNDARTQNLDFIHGARWAEAKLKEKNT